MNAVQSPAAQGSCLQIKSISECLPVGNRRFVGATSCVAGEESGIRLTLQNLQRLFISVCF